MAPTQLVGAGAMTSTRVVATFIYKLQGVCPAPRDEQGPKRDHSTSDVSSNNELYTGRGYLILQTQNLANHPLLRSKVLRTL